MRNGITGKHFFQLFGVFRLRVYHGDVFVSVALAAHQSGYLARDGVEFLENIRFAEQGYGAAGVLDGAVRARKERRRDRSERLGHLFVCGNGFSDLHSPLRRRGEKPPDGVGGHQLRVGVPRRVYKSRRKRSRRRKFGQYLYLYPRKRIESERENIYPSEPRIVFDLGGETLRAHRAVPAVSFQRLQIAAVQDYQIAVFAFGGAVGQFFRSLFQAFGGNAVHAHGGYRRENLAREPRGARNPAVMPQFVYVRVDDFLHHQHGALFAEHAFTRFPGGESHNAGYFDVQSGFQPRILHDQLFSAEGIRIGNQHYRTPRRLFQLLEHRVGGAVHSIGINDLQHLSSLPHSDDGAHAVSFGYRHGALLGKSSARANDPRFGGIRSRVP